MSSNASSGENRVTVSAGNGGWRTGLVTHRSRGERRPRTRHDIEREVLCRRITTLERELERERRRRERVIDRYERLLEQARVEEERTGLLAGLF